MRPQTIATINDRDYARPAAPAIVICLDGCEPAYLDRSIKAELMPNLEAMLAKGTSRTARSAMPSFTNPNNLSIATGRPASVHGICGNFFFDPDQNVEVMMNDPSFLRAPTIFSGLAEAGLTVAIVTAKDKLRALLGAGLDFATGRAICFSAEKADRTRIAENGIDDAAAWLARPVPEVYSADLSEFVFAAGVKLLNTRRPDVMYLTTTDFIQHKHAPGSDEANAFYAMFDRYLGELDARGATIVITADHGMKPKHTDDGTPDVIWLQSLIDQWTEPGSARIILPITDPYVVHHGALGSFATVYLPDGADHAAILDTLRRIDGIDLALDRGEAGQKFELPEDRIGDLVVTTPAGKAIGIAPEHHDLTVLDAPLRSHGGRDEQIVPFIVNRPPEALPPIDDLRNFDAFFVALAAAAAP